MNTEITKQAGKQKGTDANRDPITGTPGAHPQEKWKRRDRRFNH